MKSRAARGYVALMSTIVVGFMLLGLSVTEGMSGWFARFNVLSSENKEQASALAEGCADQALARVVADPSFPTVIDSTTDEGTCHVTIDTTTQGLATIASQGIVQGAYANLSMTVNLNNVHIGATPSTPTTGTLVVYVTVKNDNDGSNDLDDFTISIPAGNPTSFSGLASRAVTVTGNYQVSVSGPTGYSTVYSGDCNTSGAGTVAAGEAKSCTITLDDIPTTITLIANVVNDNGGTQVASSFQLKINGNNVSQNTPISVSPGSHSVSGPASGSDYNASDWGYQCSGAPASGSVSLVAGDQKTCVINYNDTVPPLSCSETVMMLDRTGTVFNDGVNDEIRDAAVRLLGNDLYGGVSPRPKVGVGSFVQYPNTSTAGTASVPSNGRLTTNYVDLISLITNMMNTNPSAVGTDLEETIRDGDAELNGSEHVSGKNKVLILVSDGEPTGDLAGACPTPPGGWVNNNTGGGWNTSNWPSGFVCTTAQQSARNAAGDAKSGTGPGKHIDGIPTEIFTIHFGAGGPGNTNKNLLADIATDSAYNPPNAAGSTPTSNYNPPGNSTTESGDGGWANASGAQSEGNTDASDNNGDRQQYRDFNFSFPANASPTGIEVLADAWSTGSPTTLLTLDSFGNANTSDVPNWLDEGGSDTNDTYVTNSTNRSGSATAQHTRLRSGGMITRTVNTSGSENITLNYYWRGDSDGDSTDNIIIQWKKSSDIAFLTLKTHLLSSQFSSWSGQMAAVLPPEANNTSIDIRFLGSSNNDNEEARVDDVSVTGTTIITSSCQLGVSLSWNGGGSSWTSEKLSLLTGTEQTFTLGSAIDNWGYAGWATGDLDNGSFRVRVRDVDPGSSCADNATTHLDYIRAKVHYTYPNDAGENTDDDHFFIAPTPDDMDGVFETIGKLACEALSVATTPPPTTATLTVITSVVNDSGTGSKAPSDFTMNVTGSSPSLSTFSGAASPGTGVTLSPGNYGVTGSADLNYTISYGVNCSNGILGPIAAGEARACTVTYDDKTPPPPPPNLDINLGSWEEKPE